MSRQKDMYMDFEEMFHDDVAERVPTFETYQCAFDWAKAHAEVKVPWMANDLSALEQLVTMYWDDYQSDNIGDVDWHTEWADFGEVYE